MRRIEVMLKIVNGLRIIAERICREVAENVKLITGKDKIFNSYSSRTRRI